VIAEAGKHEGEGGACGGSGAGGGFLRIARAERGGRFVAVRGDGDAALREGAAAVSEGEGDIREGRPLTLALSPRR
jgi:hypothetical protein